MPAEKIFIRETKTGYLATYNGVKGKAKTMFKAIERAKKNYDWLEEEKTLQLASILCPVEFIRGELKLTTQERGT